MAADTISFLDAVGVEGAHLVGWSDGAVVALLVARQRPDLARRLVLIGQPVNVDGLPDEMRAALSHGLTKQLLPPMLEELYAATSPDGPTHFDVVAEKLFALYKLEPNIELDELVVSTRRPDDDRRRRYLHRRARRGRLPCAAWPRSSRSYPAHPILCQ